MADFNSLTQNAAFLFYFIYLLIFWLHSERTCTRKSSFRLGDKDIMTFKLSLDFFKDMCFVNFFYLVIITVFSDMMHAKIVQNGKECHECTGKDHGQNSDFVDKSGCE